MSSHSLEVARTFKYILLENNVSLNSERRAHRFQNLVVFPQTFCGGINEQSDVLEVSGCRLHYN